MRENIRQSAVYVVIIIMLLCLIAACAPQTRDEIAQPSGAISFPLEIIDQAGKVVRIERMPEKIVTLAPSNTEIIYALGLEDRLIGVTKYCNYPVAAQQKPKVGGFSDVNIEQVIAINPDLVLAANIHKDETTPELERLGLTVITVDPHTIDQVLEAIRMVGSATGMSEAAFDLTSDMESRIRVVTSKTAEIPKTQRPKVLYILWHDPLKTASATSRIHELITKAGGINIASELEGDYPTISLEAVLMADPQVIIAGSGHGAGQDVPFQFALSESRLAEVAARINGRIYEINADIISRPGPRIVDGLEMMVQFIHPELFKDIINGN